MACRLDRRQAIIWINAGMLLIGPLGTNFNEILIEIHTFWFRKMYLKMSSAKWRPFRLGPNVLITTWKYLMAVKHHRYHLKDTFVRSIWWPQIFASPQGVHYRRYDKSFDDNAIQTYYSVMCTTIFFLKRVLYTHDDVIKWNHFPRYWCFVRGIHRSRWITRTKASYAEPWCFLWSAPE